MPLGVLGPEGEGSGGGDMPAPLSAQRNVHTRGPRQEASEVLPQTHQRHLYV